MSGLVWQKILRAETRQAVSLRLSAQRNIDVHGALSWCRWDMQIATNISRQLKIATQTVVMIRLQVYVYNE